MRRDSSSRGIGPNTLGNQIPKISVSGAFVTGGNGLGGNYTT